MSGDNQVRFCSECKLNVYNLSEMSTAEAEDLIRSREGRLCVRFYQRADGKVLTRDCPKGLMAVRMRLARTIALTAGLVAGSFGVAIARESPKPEDTWVDQAIAKGRTVPVVDKVIEKICPSIQGDVTVGRIATPTTLSKGP